MKRLILFVAIAAILGGGIYYVTQVRPAQPSHQEQTLQEGTENGPSGPEYFEPSETLARNIIAGALDIKFNAKTANYQVADLDGQGGPELIVAATENIPDLYARPSTAIIQVLSVKNREGEYESIGHVEYTELLWGTPEVKEVRDLNGDGDKEIFMELMYGGAASFAQGVLTVDIQRKEVGWAKLQEKSRAMGDALFIVAASAMHWNTVAFTDTDGDGRGEITTVFAQRDVFNPADVACQVEVYEWNESLFAYAEQLSLQTANTLGAECRLP
ncbi:MAG TPA: hypothetical protein VFE94_01605 [Candidatus Paceibacterota bacterium]|nr:hypothetical protein [Candidatus Paceibacterota bacterium]